MLPKKIHILPEDLEILDAKTEIHFTRASISINPHKDRAEYTDLSQVWHDEEKERPETENGKFVIWWSFIEDKVTKWKWAYMENLLPKGNEKYVTKCYKTNTNSKDEEDF